MSHGGIIMKSQIGLIGFGVMGKALAGNLLNNEFTLSGFTRTYNKMEQLKEVHGNKFNACTTLEEFVDSLEKPRKIIMMVPAGKPVEDLINTITSHLDKGDILMDCGNSFYKDTIKHHKTVEAKGIYYYGVGVSGGEKGALLGPSIMPGGDFKVYSEISPFLEKISAKKDGQFCCAYMGPNGAGHYVKMVHNGIEYADMQIISEIYLYFKYAQKLSNEDISKIFEEWNNTEVGSYLIEITYKILLEKDPLTQNDLIDMIVDRAGQKGTGKWTIIDAADLSQNLSIIQAAVDNRIISGLDQERKSFSTKFKNSKKMDLNIASPSIDEVRQAYFIGKLVAYGQGFSLMAQASDEYNWNLNLANIASIFRAGCIIQAKLLETLMKLYNSEPDLKNFLLSQSMLETISNHINSLRHLNLVSTLNEIPNPTLSSALIYIDQLKSVSVGANLIQAQRDYFGAHTFERIDQEGSLHHEWKNQ